MDIVVRLSKDAELLARLNEPVQELHRSLYPEYFKEFNYEDNLTYYKDQLGRDGFYCYVVSVDGNDAGYALFFIRKYEENPFRYAYLGIHIDQICILPIYKRKGLGSILMEKIRSFGIEKGATQLELTYWEDNLEAKTFYDHKGFKTNFRFVAKQI